MHLDHETDWIKLAEKTDFRVVNIIDGKGKPCANGKAVEKYSGRNGAKVTEFGEGSDTDVEAAVDAANRAHLQGRWSEISVHQRRNVLSTLADLVDANSTELALKESIDTGKPISHARDDVSLVANIFRATADAGDKVNGPSVLDGDVFSYQLRKPIGVVGAIVGWNYPLVLAAKKIAPALVMGNCLVLKPSEFTSLSTFHLAELALEAGVPEGVFNVVNGSGAIIGDSLAKHNDIRLLSFTGSSATGKRLLEASGKSNMKRLILECGGKSPFIIFDDYEGDIDALAKHIVLNTAFRNQGALCVSSTRILLQEGIRERVLERILDHTKDIEPEDPLLNATTFGAIMSEAHMRKVLDYVQVGIDEGAQLISGGTRVLEETGGFYLTPTIFDRVRPSHRIAVEEIFGPLIGVFAFRSENEAITLANDSEYGLAAYVATNDVRRIQRLSRKLDAGTIAMISALDGEPGGVHFGTEPQKQSGIGIEGGLAGLMMYTRASQIFVQF